jgi:hypothetical protein
MLPPGSVGGGVRTIQYRGHPGVALDEATMQSLNSGVHEKKRRPGDVAREFLGERQLIPAAR